jgi:ketol-acid reductoisomerase
MKDKIAIIGYGSQGRSWALNLRDSGCDIVVGLPPKDSSRRMAQKDGIKNLTTIAKAASQSEIIIFAFPDHLHGRVFKKSIRPHLRPQAALVFLHGFSVHFKTVVIPRDCDVILLAPLGPGTAVREEYLAGQSVGYFFSIHQNATGRARAALRQLTRGLKIDEKKLIRTTFKEEAIGDLFGEQAVLCGGLSQLIKAGHTTLVKAGLSSDKAYLEVAYQLDLIIELIKKHGIEGMLRKISLAARYGTFLTGPKIIDAQTRKRMRQILSEITTGRFAGQLDSLTPAKIKKLNSSLSLLTTPAFEKSARKFSCREGK